MPAYIGALAILALMAIVLIRVRFLKNEGITAMKFAALDKSDFLILPFILAYFYFVFANALRPSKTLWLSWIGAAFCGVALLLLIVSLVSFGRSFRVGIDSERPDELVTSGIFGISRNPMYVAFWLLLFGEFLIQPNPVFLAYLVAGAWLFHRQVLREESYLSERYGEKYRRYCERVGRYF